jgi:SAM-dependent methyltransferase
MPADYNKLAEAYKTYRKPDPRIAERIHFHLRNARSILNLGSGTGAYEPDGPYIVALEPSFEMIMKRGRSPVTQVMGVAEKLPFRDSAFDCSMGILTLHHWADITSGLQEMFRVTTQKIVLFTWTGYCGNFWLIDYLPEIAEVDAGLFPSLVELEGILGDMSTETIEIPSDCTDGFMCAYWKRPEIYLDTGARKAISTFLCIPVLNEKLDKLREDIKSGEWHKKYSSLLDRDSLDLGYRLLVSEKKK